MERSLLRTLLYVVFGFSSLAVAVAVYERKDEALVTPFAFAVGTAAALAISSPPSPQEGARSPAARPGAVPRGAGAGRPEAPASRRVD